MQVDTAAARGDQFGQGLAHNRRQRQAMGAEADRDEQAGRPPRPDGGHQVGRHVDAASPCACRIQRHQMGEEFLRPDQTLGDLGAVDDRWRGGTIWLLIFSLFNSNF